MIANVAASRRIKARMDKSVLGILTGLRHRQIAIPISPRVQLPLLMKLLMHLPASGHRNNHLWRRIEEGDIANLLLEDGAKGYVGEDLDD